MSGSPSDRTLVARAPAGDVAAPPKSGRTWPIVITFFLFAGLIPETLVTSSTSPLKMVLNPLSLPFIALFYGTADLVIREMMLRRRAGLASGLLWGAAFGFLNEGVVAGTWYRVRPDGYIFIAGVDWTWALALTVFHTVVSVIVPIAFIEILFPSVRGRSLVGPRGIVVCLLLLVACTLVAIGPMNPPVGRLLPDRLLVWTVAVIMSVVALALPARRRKPPAERPRPGLWQLRFAGFFAMFAFFFVIYAFPVLIAKALSSVSGGLVIAQAVDAAAILALATLVISRGWSWSHRAGWSPRENLALLIGGVTFTALVLNLTQAAMGEPFATLPFYALLVALTVRWNRTPPLGLPA